MHSLVVLLLRRRQTSSSEGLPISSWINLQVPAHGRPAFIASFGRSSHAIVVAGWRVVLDCSSESSPKGRDIVSILSLVVFGSFAVGGGLSTSWSAVAPGVLQVALTAVGIEHVHAHSSLGVEELSDHRQQLLEVKPVLLLDLQHTDQHPSDFLSEFFANPLQFLEEWIKSDFEVLVVIDEGKVLAEDDFDQHESKGKHIGLDGIVLGIGSILRVGDHLLG